MSFGLTGYYKAHFVSCRLGVLLRHWATALAEKLVVLETIQSCRHCSRFLDESRRQFHESNFHSKLCGHLDSDVWPWIVEAEIQLARGLRRPGELNY